MKNAKASCTPVTVDWGTSAKASNRYAFIGQIEIGECAFVTNGDDRIRSAVKDYSRKWPRVFTTTAVDGGMLIRRVS